MSTKEWTKEQEIALINKTQNEYIDELIEKIFSEKQSEKAMKFINFTSPTGTGKTKMMSKLINKLPNCFFIITTLSRGHLNKQVEDSITKDCIHNNYIVYGAMSYTKSSILTEQDIFNELPPNKPIFWLRDEGHINTNNWSKTLTDKCDKIINFSATNKEDGGIVCNFTHTMMLRTVNQQQGTIEDAIKKLKEVKKTHKNVSNYNPCAIFRVVNSQVCSEIEKLCKKYKLKTISIVDNNNFDMQDLCEDDNEYDVIINKQKIVEGIDIRRAHILWMENEPSNPATTIQVIGRCRRNALLWRNDIDILAEENRQLLYDTRQCFVFYNVLGMKISNDENGELSIAFCPYISVEKLKTGHTIYVKDGQMENGLHIMELKGCTGYYTIKRDEQTGFNIVDNDIFYLTECEALQKCTTQIDFILRKFQYMNQEKWTKLKNDCKKLLHFDYFAYEEYRLKNNKIIYKKFEPIVTENGNFFQSQQKTYNISKTNNKPNIDVDDDINKIMPTLQKNQTVYKYRKIDSIFIFTPDVSIPIKNFYNFFKYKDCDLFGYRDYAHWFTENNADKIYTDSSKYETRNNALIAILGCEECAPIKIDGKIEWLPSNSVTRKIDHSTKLSSFIDTNYKNELQLAEQQYFSKSNNFKFDKKFNSCLGYCVEYYAKYLLYGKDYFGDFYYDAKSEMGFFEKEIPSEDIYNTIIVRACILKYRQMMTMAFGKYAGRFIRSHSCDTLFKNKDFVETVVKLGINASNFIKENINIQDSAIINPILKTNHIVGLTDILDKKTIIDIKCTNTINEKMIKQTLAYHFLSQFREDLNIERVIVYDSVSNKHITLNILQTKEKETFEPNEIISTTFYGTSIYESIVDFYNETKQHYIHTQTTNNLLAYFAEKNEVLLFTKHNKQTIEDFFKLLSISKENKENNIVKEKFQNNLNQMLNQYIYLKHFQTTQNAKKIIATLISNSLLNSKFRVKTPSIEIINNYFNFLNIDIVQINEPSVNSNITNNNTANKTIIGTIKEVTTIYDLIDNEPITILKILNNNINEQCYVIDIMQKYQNGLKKHSKMLDTSNILNVKITGAQLGNNDNVIILNSMKMSIEHIGYRYLSTPKIETESQELFSFNENSYEKSFEEIIEETVVEDTTNDVSENPFDYDDITDYFDVKNIIYVDKRHLGGALWLIGGLELSDLVEKCKEFNVFFKYKPTGGRATKGKSGWWAR